MAETWLNTSRTREDVSCTSTPLSDSETGQASAWIHPGTKELLPEGCFVSTEESLFLSLCPRHTLLLTVSLTALLWAGNGGKGRVDASLFSSGKTDLVVGEGW